MSSALVLEHAYNGKEELKLAISTTYLALSKASSASNLSLHAKNVSTVTGSPCGTII